jgi:nucleoside-diphosphate-sugar epimerase
MHNILVTGGTGFIGSALIKKIASQYTQNMERLNIDVISRNRTEKLQYSKNVTISYHSQALESLTSLPALRYEFVIHAASPTPMERFTGSVSELDRFISVIKGGIALLNLSQKVNFKKLLFLSSGAVYHQVEDILPDEKYQIAPSTLDSFAFYSEAKRAVETLCLLTAQNNNFEVVIARIFAIVGPGMYLNNDSNYIFSSFIRNASDGNPYKINGNSKSIRSFMHIEDCADVLMSILKSGVHKNIYNVGSDEAVTLAQLANLFNSTLDLNWPINFNVNENLIEKSIFVPNIDKIKMDFNWFPKYTLAQSIKETFMDYQLRKNAISR